MVVIYNVDVGSCEIEASQVEVAESKFGAAVNVCETEKETTGSGYTLVNGAVTCEGSIVCRKIYLRPNLLHTETLQSAPARFTFSFACAEGCWRRHHRRTFVSSQLASRSAKECMSVIEYQRTIYACLPGTNRVDFRPRSSWHRHCRTLRNS